MLYFLAELLKEHIGAFGVFGYLSFRAILGVLTALGLSMLLGPWVIRKLVSLQVGQAIREDGPQSHLSKSGTPTMGGALILFSIGLSTLLWGDLSNKYVLVVLFVTFSFGLVGWVDDYRKVVEKIQKVCQQSGNIYGKAYLGCSPLLCCTQRQGQVQKQHFISRSLKIGL